MKAKSVISDIGECTKKNEIVSNATKDLIKFFIDVMVKHFFKYRCEPKFHSELESNLLSTFFITSIVNQINSFDLPVEVKKSMFDDILDLMKKDGAEFVGKW